MNKMVLLFASVCMIFMTSCSVNDNESSVGGEEETSNQIMETLETNIAGTDDVSDPHIDLALNSKAYMENVEEIIKKNKPPYEVLEALENVQKNLDDSSYEAYDNLLKKVIWYMQDYQSRYQEKIQSADIDQVLFSLGLTIDKSQLPDDIEPAVKNVLDEILNGYTIEAQGEAYGVRIDYALLKTFSKERTGPTHDFIDLKAYSDTFFMRLKRHNSVNIDEFVDRLVQIESHLKTWPDSPFKNEVNELYKTEIMLYYLGSMDYEIFDFTTNKIIPERLEMIKKHMEKYEGSLFSEIGYKYMFELNEREYAYHPEYIQLIENFKKFGIESDMVLGEKRILENSQSVFLPQISRHENMTIQESMNKILMDEVKNAKISTGYSVEGRGSFYFNYYVYFATPKLLSLECMGSHNLQDWTLDRNHIETFTFNVQTGEPMTLEQFMKQDITELDTWLLPYVNHELEAYFGSEYVLQTLEGVRYIVQKDSLTVIGENDTHRAYVPLWKLEENTDWRERIH